MPSDDGEEYFETYLDGKIAARAALQLGREMSDARAMEIREDQRVKSLRQARYVALRDSLGMDEPTRRAVSAAIGRLYEPEPKTREQVLEDALRRFVERLEPSQVTPCAAIVMDILEESRRALEWRP